MIRPTYLQRSLAYIANGDMPPLPRPVRDAGVAFAIVTTLCLGVALIVGGSL